ncbi:MAG: glycerate kinase [Verrucomicrobia bacterium]|nr:glycerate kinase [Verrucomicrobiota bacterium]MBI3867511.1 glycerate kinase [Verrucomicrobiota bacterium]
MSLRLLIVPDKFKGTLTAAQAAASIAAGWRQSRPSDSLELLPMNDGGDGFGAITAELLQAEEREAITVDAAHRPCRARWWFQPKTHVAIIEAAQVNGLAQLPKGEFHPFDLDTFGLGEVLGAATRAGASECLVGIGGSATNDAGFGLARSLGWRFLDARGKSIDSWTNLTSLRELIAPTPTSARWTGAIRVAVDVENPLLGPQGCTRIYGPQKGLRAEDYPAAEAALERLAEVVAQRHDRRPPVHALPGSGAAGGLGFGWVAFADATLVPGFELFAKLAGLREAIERADVVVTAEGRIDASSMMGKGVGGVLRLCQALGKPCLGLAGHRDGSLAAGVDGFRKIAALTDDCEPAIAQAEAAPRLQKLAVAIARMKDWMPSQ